MTGREPLLDFLEDMRRLRRDCPWKREQTHRSLARYLEEEASETLEAIDTGDADHLREELGDLLLQVYFHAVIAEESGDFTLDDVARGISDKMHRRNPHVFGADTPSGLSAARGERPVAGDQARRAARPPGRPSPYDGIARRAARAAARDQDPRAASGRRDRSAGRRVTTAPISATACWPWSTRRSARAWTPSRPCATPYAGPCAESAQRGNGRPPSRRKEAVQTRPVGAKRQCKHAESAQRGS